jgi:outer membrane protein TolC
MHKSKTLSLKDAITYALENKSDAKKARLKVENSKYQIQEVRSRALPKITANGGLTYNPILQTTFLDAGSLAVIRHYYSSDFWSKWISTAGVSLTQNLFDQSVLLD